MAKLPKYFIMQVWEEIISHITLGKSETSTEGATSVVEDILNYFKDNDEYHLIQRIYDESFKNDEIQENLRISRKRRNQTKKRWVQAVIKEYESPKGSKSKNLIQEHEVLTNFKKMYGDNRFKEAFGASSIEEVMQEKIESLQEWSKNTSSYLCNFIFLLDKTPSQIEKALTADIIVIIGDTLMSRYGGKIQDVVVEKPYSIVDHPIFSDNRGKLPLSEDILEENLSSYRYNDYSPSEDYKLRVLVSSEYADDKQVRLLDATDENIFSEVLNQRSNMFATQRKIFVNIGTIVKNLFKSDGVENYRIVEARLFKMLNMRFNVFHKEGSVGFGIFDFVKVDYTNGWTAEISINEQIYQEYLNKQTIRMYKDIIQKFELPISQSLIFALQKERFYCYSQKQSYKQVYDYSFFTHKLRFKSRSKKENYALIEASLQEIVDHGVTIKSFAREGEIFYIEYIKVTEYEVEDLLHSPSKIDQILNFTTSTALIEESS